MASQPPSPRLSKFRATLEYFDKYDYPLTKKELIYWFSPGTVGEIAKTGDYYHLPGRGKIVKQRLEREEISQKKWAIARQAAEKLKMFPTIRAVFVTGALAMNNSPKDDDIDFMIVTTANSLWLTRFWVDAYLIIKKMRRPSHLSEHASDRVTNTVCDNVWLDEAGLSTEQQSLYVAHEIAQAKIVWDRDYIAHKFLISNTWVNDYLPNSGGLSARENNSRQYLSISLLLWPINLLFFIIQYLYMLPKKTTERVALHQAFFHPRASV